MADPSHGFSEKSFYLAEFRGRSLAIALPGDAGAGLDELAPVVDELTAANTRVVLLAPDADGLLRIPGIKVLRAGEEGWIGALWRLLRGDQKAGLVLGADGFAAHCRRFALRLGLAKLVWIDPRGCLRGPSGDRVPVLDAADVREMLASKGAAGATLSADDLGLLGEIQGMLEGGLPAVNLCSLDGLAADLFTYAGSGTFFTRERYAHVRRLALDDFDAAADLVARGVSEGYLVARSEGELERVLSGGFGVFIEGRYLAGIGSLIGYPGDGAGEIASLYTLTRFIGEGVGSHLIRFALECAAEAGFGYVFACTTSERVERFFVRQGFRVAGLSEVPASKWSGYSEARRTSIRCLRIEVRTES